MNWVEKINPYFELMYYISGILLLIGLGISIYQLILVKRDIILKNKRASIEKSIEYLSWFATEFIPKQAKYQESLRRNNVAIYKSKDINNSFQFSDDYIMSKEEIKFILDSFKNGVISLLNELEFFSAAFVSGLADEELAFNPIAHLFCNFVEDHYSVICYMRKMQKKDLFSHTVRLYVIWSNKLNKMKLEIEMKEIFKKMSLISNDKADSLGI